LHAWKIFVVIYCRFSLQERFAKIIEADANEICLTDSDALKCAQRVQTAMPLAKLLGRKLLVRLAERVSRNGCGLSSAGIFTC
jgi:hypothetical protein